METDKITSSLYYTLDTIYPDVNDFRTTTMILLRRGYKMSCMQTKAKNTHELIDINFVCVCVWGGGGGGGTIIIMTLFSLQLQEMWEIYKRYNIDLHKSQACLVSVAMTNLDLLPSLDGFESVCLWLLTQLSYKVSVLVGAGEQCFSCRLEPLMTCTLDPGAVSKSIRTRLFLELLEEATNSIRTR